MLRMPSGCFEQTSSMTYPNVLVTDYMKRTKKINPEIQMKAEQYINLGYQRLVTFEVQGGGFSWFGDAPAHKVLTAYGLMEFSDMAKVHEVDPAVITRTQQWLAKQQKADGSWEQDQGGIAEGIINRQTDVLRTSAYIAWALADSGYKGPEVEKAVNYVAPKIDSVNDAYVAAVNANLMVACDRKGDRTLKALEKLVSLKVEKDKVVYWTSSAPTMTNGKGETADLETTGLAVYALLKSGRYPGLVNKALTYLVQNKDAFGTWQTTQATVWSMKALTLATDKATGETNAEVTVSLNGKKSESFAITPEDSDVMRQIDLKPLVQEGKNEVAIQFSGEGGALYQISARYYTPWTKTGPADELLSIDVNYDRTELAVNDFVTCNVRIANNQRGAANMVVVDLGIPP
ncbi:MAG: alpha-2-macroglobulin, partial [Armatimonadetes bacterium CG_4_9_14_3_um_filter_58_7]